MEFDPTTGDLVWPICTAGYEIVDVSEEPDVPDAPLGANFLRPEVQQSHLLKRGVLRAKGDEFKMYTPSRDAPILADQNAVHASKTVPLRKTITHTDIIGYADVTGDTNPLHLNEEFACQISDR